MRRNNEHLLALNLCDRGVIKDRTMITQSQFPDVAFVAKLDNTKVFFAALKALNFSNDVTVQVDATGLRVTVEDSKYVQATIYIAHDCFAEFQLRAATGGGEPIVLRVSLSVVCDTVSIFTGVDSTLQIIYKGDGAPLVFVIEDQSDDEPLVTECSIKTKCNEELMEFRLDKQDASYASMIFIAADFLNLLNEIQRGTNELKITISPTTPCFRLSFSADHLETELEWKRNSESIEKMKCNRKCQMTYRMSHIRMLQKSLSLSNRVSLQTDSSHLLKLRMILTPDDAGRQMYIDFFITPLEDDDDEDDDE